MNGIRTLMILLLIGVTGILYGQDCHPRNDSAILVDFYGATRGLNWKVKWDLNKAFRNWKGVRVNQAGCVTALEVPDNGLQGNIPNLDLPFLEQLDISGNNILSSLPALSKVPALVHLNVADNRFHGPLPALSSSTGLEVLIANHNEFDGAIPDYSEFKALRQIDLSENNLSGGIEVISHFPELRTINLSNNQFEGSIPKLNDKVDLTEIDLSNNHLEGGLPALDSLANLTKVNFSQNRLSGPFQWPVQVPELTEILISDNALTDTISHTGPVGKLIRFYAGNNQFSGTIPDMELPQLKELVLSHNQFTGHVPDFSGLPALEQFTVNSNELVGIDFGPDFITGIGYSDVSDNRMTFDDLVPFHEFRGTRIVMFPQKPVPFETSSFTVTKGNNYVIRLDTDEDDYDTDYLWYRNGKRLEAGRLKEFSISNIVPRDAGEYTVTLVNSNFPRNEIASEVFTLMVNCPDVIEERTIYLCPGEEYNYKGEIFSRDTTFTDTVFAQTNLVCDSLYFIEIITHHPDSVEEEVELCAGEIYYFGPDSIQLTRSGYYLDTFPNIGGCDSIVRLELTFRPSYHIVRDEGYCPGDSLVLDDTVYYADVDLVDTFSSIYGCDSIVFRQVRFSDPVRTLTRYDICAGDSVLIDGEFFHAAISWVDTLQAQGGCDSISTVEVVVRDVYEATLHVQLCSPETYEWQGRELTESGQYSDTLQTIYGCDSIVHLDLTISPSYFSRDTLYMCEGDSISFNGAWLTSGGIYFSDKTTSAGCDSMNVLVLEFRDYAEQWLTAQFCEQDTFYYNDKHYLFPGIYYDTLYAEAGCDTLITLDLTWTELKLSDSIITGTNSADSTGSIEVVLSGGTAPYQYLWDTGDTTAIVDSLMPGEYTLTVIDANGCTETFTLTVPVLTFAGSRLERHEWVRIRPNYINRQDRKSVFVDAEEGLVGGRISLYNELGQEVSHREVDYLAPGESLLWDLQVLPAGMYFFHVRSDKEPGIQVERLVVF